MIFNIVESIMSKAFIIAVSGLGGGNVFGKQASIGFFYTANDPSGNYVLDGILLTIAWESIF